MHFVNEPRRAMLADMGNRQRAAGVALMLASSSASQTGAGIGALAFPVLGPVGVVAVRQWVAGVILLVVGRPRLRALTRRQWLPIVLLAGVFAAMNVSLYSAVARVGLGLAVTLEFLGPLSVALGGGVAARGERGRTLARAPLAPLGGGGLPPPPPPTPP